MLAVGIVHQHHREAEFARTVHAHQAQYARGGFLAAAYDLVQELGELAVNQVHQVSAVVYDHIRTHFYDPAAVGHIFLRRRVVPGEDVQPVVHEGRCHVVLGGERVAAGHVHFGPACGEHLAEIGRLGLEMHRECHSEPGKGLFGAELLLKGTQQRHVMFYPFDLEPAVLPE